MKRSKYPFPYSICSLFHYFQKALRSIIASCRQHTVQFSVDFAARAEKNGLQSTQCQELVSFCFEKKNQNWGAFRRPLCFRNKLSRTATIYFFFIPFLPAYNYLAVFISLAKQAFSSTSTSCPPSEQSPAHTFFDMLTVQWRNGKKCRPCLKPGAFFTLLSSQTIHYYCNRRNFRTRFNFVYFVLLAESTKFSSIRKLCTHTSVYDIALAVRKFIAYESSRALEYEIFNAYENFCDYSNTSHGPHMLRAYLWLQHAKTHWTQHFWSEDNILSFDISDWVVKN